MIKDLTKPLQSSFLSCEKDSEIILRRLFVENPQHADVLKRLLVINTKDCLDNTTSEVYKNKLAEMTLQKLIEEQYVTLTPKIMYDEHTEVKSSVILNYEVFVPNQTNDWYRDATITFDILCFTDYWDLGNYRSRPLKIAGYIDGLLDKTHLTGIGWVTFESCRQLVVSPNIAGYTLTYRAVHGSDDRIEPTE